MASKAGTIDPITVSLQISNLTPSLGADFQALGVSSECQGLVQQSLGNPVPRTGQHVKLLVLSKNSFICFCTMKTILILVNIRNIHSCDYSSVIKEMPGAKVGCQEDLKVQSFMV